MSSAVTLLCRYATVEDLLLRARALPDAPGAGSTRVACEASETTEDGGRRLRLEPDAVEFVETQAPDLAARWPQVFESVEWELGDAPTLGAIVARMHGWAKGHAELETTIDPTGDVVEARIRLGKGDALVVRPQGAGLSLTWEQAPPRLSELAMTLVERERREQRRTFRRSAQSASLCDCGRSRDEHDGSAAWCP